MILEDLEEAQNSFDVFVHSPLFRPVDAKTIAHACVEAHARKYPIPAIVKTMETISSEDRVREPIRSILNPLRYALDTITVLACTLVFPFDGNSESGFLGGSEEAIVCLSRALARLGRRVIVYTRLPPFTLTGTMFEGVEYRDTCTFHPDGEHGTLVVWREPEPVQDVLDPIFVRPGLFGLHMWMHDSDECVDSNAYGNMALMCDTVSTLTSYHKKCLSSLCEDANYVNIPNGIETNALPDLDTIHRDSFRVAYTSCPSRGLRILLDMWPTVRRTIPQAHLDICYDWTAFEAQYPSECARMRRQIDSLEGVTLHGGLSHADLHEVLAQTNVWAYAHFHLTYMETFCISALKALAMGCTVLTVPNGALPEVIGDDGRFVNTPGEYTDALIYALQNSEDEAIRRSRALRIRYTHDWSHVAKSVSSIWTCHAEYEGMWRNERVNYSHPMDQSSVVCLNDITPRPHTRRQGM